MPLWLLGLQVYVAITWSIRLTSGAVLLSDLQRVCIYYNTTEMPPQYSLQTSVCTKGGNNEPLNGMQIWGQQQTELS